MKIEAIDVRHVLERIRNMTDGHPIDAGRRDRINALARAGLADLDLDAEPIEPIVVKEVPSAQPVVYGPLPWKMLLNRTNRLRKFVEMEPMAPRSIILNEIELIEAATEKWRRENEVIARAASDAERVLTGQGQGHGIARVLRVIVHQAGEYDSIDRHAEDDDAGQ